MVKIICLANSKKNGDRCIAGIDICTEKWIRPVSRLEDGSIPASKRLINGKEPQLLDILDIPVDKTGENFGFASENLNIIPGQWQKVGQFVPNQLIKYCNNNLCVLHNAWKFVEVTFLKRLPFSQRKTIQLVYVEKLLIEWDEKKMKWRGSLHNINSTILNGLPITDPKFIEALRSGYKPQNPCLVTVSLSLPHNPLIDNWGHGAVCWKLIAGVIELF